MKLFNGSYEACTRQVRNEKGMVLVTTLLIMVILLIMGTVSVTIRNTEQRIVTNTEVFQHNFYSVEGVTLEGVSNIADIPDIDFTTGSLPTWLRVYDPTLMDIRDNAEWGPSGLITPKETALTSGVMDISPQGYTDLPATAIGFVSGNRIGSAVSDKGVCGGSLTDPTKQERCFDVFGMYDVDKDSWYSGKMLMMIGYKRVVYL